MSLTFEEKYRDFIMKRCEAVINSCKTERQLGIALNYCRNFKNVYYGFKDMEQDVWNLYFKKNSKLAIIETYNKIKERKNDN